MQIHPILNWRFYPQNVIFAFLRFKTDWHFKHRDLDCVVELCLVQHSIISLIEQKKKKKKQGHTILVIHTLSISLSLVMNLHSITI